MKYRVMFTLGTGPCYYTEWLDTPGEAQQFIDDAKDARGVFVLNAEDEDGEPFGGEGGENG